MWKRLKITGALLVLALASPLQATGSGFSNMYVLGDSLSDQGNLFAATQLFTGSAIGIPRADHYEDGRFSNGEIYADVLARELDVLLTPSYLSTGNNFAFGGTRTDYNTVEVKFEKPEPFDLLDQGELFPRGLAPWTLNRQREAFNDSNVDDTGGLYVVFSGSNDLVDIIEVVLFGLVPEGQTDEQFILSSLASVNEGIRSVIEAFVDAGAQEILVPNMPNLGVVPGFTAYGDVVSGLAARLSAMYNMLFLQPMLAEFEDKVNIIPLDTYGVLTGIVNEVNNTPGGAYGFTNATMPCYTGFVGPLDDGTECDNPEEYVFWDFEHPTTTLHALLAEVTLASFVPDMLEYLSYQVSALDSSRKFKQSLSGKLDGATDKFASGKSADAAAKLEEFIQKIIDKQGKLITEEEALPIIMRAEKIIALLVH